MDCSLPGSSVHGIFQARVPEWVAIAFSKLTVRGMQKKIRYGPCLHECHSQEEGKATVRRRDTYLVRIEGNNFIDMVATNWEKAMATHSSTLAWKIPWMEEPGRLQYMGSLRVAYD